jgi:galactonate dehydratase
VKITQVESFLFNPGSTRTCCSAGSRPTRGIHGWGEAYVTAEKERAVDAYLKAMIPHMIRRSPFNIRHAGRCSTTTSSSGAPHTNGRAGRLSGDSQSG